MAQFRATIQGRRGDASRLGDKRSGLDVRANGWDSGVRVQASHEDGKDVFHIFQTTGSHNRGLERLLGVIEDGIYTPWWPEAR